jgi:hypothetical protein
VKEITDALDLVSTVAYEEAKKLSGTPELEGMHLSVQGLSPEGLDLDFLTEVDVLDLEEFQIRVQVSLQEGKFVGFIFKYVFGMGEPHVVRATRDAVRMALSDAIRVSAVARRELDS